MVHANSSNSISPNPSTEEKPMGGNAWNATPEAETQETTPVVEESTTPESTAAESDTIAAQTEENV